MPDKMLLRTYEPDFTPPVSDFERNEEPELKPLSKKQIKTGKSLLKKLHSQMNKKTVAMENADTDGSVYDEIFYKGMEAFRSEELLKTDECKIMISVKDLL